MDCLPRRQAQSAAVCCVAPPRATCRFLVAGLRLARQPFVGDSDRVSDYWCVMPALLENPPPTEVAAERSRQW